MGGNRIVDVCPECDRPSLRRSGTGMNSVHTDKWRCERSDCDWTGDETKARPEKRGGSASGGSRLAAKLERADPDGVIRDDD